MTCSTTTPRAWFSSHSAGVAETNTACFTMRSHSVNLSGRLSRALGSLKPNSTSVSLRLRSPRYMAPI